MTTVADRAAELRARFDREFADPPPAPAPPTIDLLRVRIGATTCAIALDEIAAVHADVVVVGLPSPVRTLRGVVAIRGQVFPIYDLGLALGWDPVGPTARWIVIARALPIGFALDHVEGHARVPLTDVATQNVIALATALPPKEP
jgi:chemotaxis signal transduction protein